jgi:hypothetical protein
MNIKKFIETNIMVDNKLISKRCRYDWFVNNNFLDVYSYILKNTDFLDTNTPLIQRLWHFYNEVYSIVVCKSDNTTPVKFKNFKEGYYLYSSNTAAQSSSEIKNKIRNKIQSKYGMSSYTQTNEFKVKAINTWLKNYGVDNPSKSKKIHDKKIKTSIKNWGKEYPIQNDVIKERLSQTNLEKYGVLNVMQNDDIRNKVSESKLRIEYDRFFNNKLFSKKITPLFDIDEYGGIDNEYEFNCNRCNTNFKDVLRGGKIPRCYQCYPNSNVSMAEVEIGDYLIELGIDIQRNVKNLIDGYEIDVWLPEYNIGIEYNGLYYHSELSGKKSKNYHIDKTNKCELVGIRLIHIFEDEWLFKNDIVKSKLKHILKLNDTKIYARNCEIIELSTAKTSNFLKKYHIQGNTSSTVRIGLIFDGDIQSVMTFSKRAIFGNTEWELVRYASKYNVVGGFSKLLKFFETNWKPKKIISYMSKNWSSTNDNVYIKNGFELISLGSPNFFVIKNGYRYNRVTYQKHKLNKILKNFDSNLTAWENLQLNGYDRIWDCGSIKYEKNIFFN